MKVFGKRKFRNYRFTESPIVGFCLDGDVIALLTVLYGSLVGVLFLCFRVRAR